MELLLQFWDLVVHLDRHLAAFVAQYGVWVYALLFTIVFCETGLVVTPFLIGRWAGPRVFRDRGSRWLNPRYLQRTHAFYEKHGGKTVIIARFVPIVRTYVPFVAGVGTMPYARFLGFSVVGALIWVVSLSLAGYFFGNLPVVKNNLSLVILGIVLLSVSPGLVAWLRHRAASVQREG
jgi:membrane-associated protein